MISVSLIYNVVLLLCCLYAAVFGGKTGIAGAIIFIAASEGTGLVSTDNWWSTGDVYLDIMVIDIACLLSLFLLATKSSRHWPIWSCGLQLASVATVLALTIDPSIRLELGRALVAFWSLPILLVMVGGTALDRQHERNLALQG